MVARSCYYEFISNSTAGRTNLPTLTLAVVIAGFRGPGGPCPSPCEQAPETGCEVPTRLGPLNRTPTGRLAAARFPGRNATSSKAEDPKPRSRVGDSRSIEAIPLSLSRSTRGHQYCRVQFAALPRRRSLR